jgi:hypothetical protein
MRIFVCKLQLHFPDSKHLRGFVCHEIFGNFFRHSEIFGLHPPPPSTIHASYGPASTSLGNLKIAVGGFGKNTIRM